MAGRALLQLVMVPAATLILGLAAILLCPFSRGGGLFLALARLWSRILFRAAGLSVEASGLELLHPGGAVLVANHASLLDPPALVLALPVNPRLVAKRGLFYIPIFGQALWAAGVVPIDRGDRERAIESLQAAAARLRAGTPLLMFPEGTRSTDGRLQPLKKGAFVLAIQAGVPVQPIVVTGARALLPRGSVFIRAGTIRVRVLPPEPTASLSHADRDRLRERVEARLRAALGEPGGVEGPGGSPSPAAAGESVA
jgi:1-acyl-sn-glycerol-3-phosphate acyltransferase